jgi:hypothetical protein
VVGGMLRERATHAVVHNIYDGPILDCIGDLVELLVHFHACGFCVVAEAETDYAAFLTELYLVSLSYGCERRRHKIVGGRRGCDDRKGDLRWPGRRAMLKASAGALLNPC